MGTSISELREGWVARLQRLEQDRIERERVEQELLVARRIQLASLPKEVPTLEGWQISPLYQPAREVGGDFYDFYELDDGRVASSWGTLRQRRTCCSRVKTPSALSLGV